jgi:DMSO/TMAO reductase YedYZ molybdopterin-dependent catalytic subunit
MTDWFAHLETVSTLPPNAGTPVDQQTGVALPQDRVYIRSNFAPPADKVDPWVVSIVTSGRHDLGLESISVFPKAEVSMVLECAGNGRTLMTPTPDGTPWTLGGVSMTTFAGVLLRDVLESVPLPADTTEFVFTGADRGAVPGEGEVPYQFSLSVDEALTGDALLALSMGGTPLAHVHGAPIRLVVPGQYAMKSVKWLRKIEAVAEPFGGHFVRKYRYFEEAGTPEAQPVGPIRVRSLIASPRAGAVVGSGQVNVAGSAWSNGEWIERVDVSGDGGSTWKQADLGSQSSRFAAVPWTATFEMAGGEAEIVCLATDRSGNTQPLEAIWNRNGYGNNVVHRVAVSVV